MLPAVPPLLHPAVLDASVRISPGRIPRTASSRAVADPPRSRAKGLGITGMDGIATAVQITALRGSERVTSRLHLTVQLGPLTKQATPSLPSLMNCPTQDRRGSLPFIKF